ncbi:MAG: acyl-CoA dehydrogenase family protein, partial [Bradyrhizobium sp.]|uniref:acyl-CoA dehydrogenase family protein n=1 Tax=Bradyrhizobium sp. TaxID=376 RepID=UPI00391DC5BF
MVTTAARELPQANEPEHIARALRLADVFAGRAAAHDRDASFPFENFADLSREGLLALTVPAALGGSGAGARDATRVLGIIGKADPSTALVLSMHYIQHLVMARSTRWPARLSRKLAKETVEEQILSLHEEKRDLVDGVLSGTDAASRLSTQ